MTVAWVIGRGGLLGAALEQALHRSGTTVFVPSRALPWSDPDATVALLVEELDRFAKAVGAAGRWEIYWAAGVGTMGSPAAAFVTESRVLRALLNGLAEAGLRGACGSLALASSAGAIYAGSTDDVIDENTAIGPTTAYAHAKLAQEDDVRAFAAVSGVRALICRISTLYGVSHAVERTQGLLTHISRSIVRNQTIRIFVPLDTIRDYIGADDAAAIMVDALRTLDAPGATVKIVASERATTISEILAIFKHISRKSPRIVTSRAATSGLYTRRIQFRSLVRPRGTREPTNLLLGIDRILAAERRRYVAAEVR